MSLEVAKRVLDEEISMIGKDGWPDDLIIEFLGGEPFINFHVIKDTCEWLWSTYQDKKFSLMCRTNGTCFTDEAKTWLKENKNRISIGLSLDGLSELQEINRRGSIQRIPIEFIINNWPNEEIKAVISPQGVHFLAESVIAFYEKNWNFNMTLAAGVEWPDFSIIELKRQLDIIIEYLIKHPNLKPVKGIFVDDFIKLCQPIDETREKMCGSYNEIVAYSPEGKKLRCHIFSEITLGKDISEYYAEDKHFPEKLELDKACQNCPAHALCSVCPGFNLLAGNDMNIQDKRVCSSMLVLLQANCKLFLLKNQERALNGQLTSLEWACLKFALQQLNV